VIGTLLTGAIVLFPATLAAADVITPTGACTASGHWVAGNFTKNSTDVQPKDVTLIPQKDTVNWEGHEMGKPIGYSGPPRPIDGQVQVELPFFVKVTVWHWGGDKSPRYSNQGQERYNVPSALIGIKLHLKGYENDNGKRVCTGEAILEVAGSKTKNPVGWAGLVGSVVFLAGLLAAGLRKTQPAYDDINP
jgi:hypothetical protein